MFNGGYGMCYPATLSASDVALLGRNEGDFGMNGGWWWAWIMMMALWGGNGYGWGNNAGAAAATQADIQRGFDNQTVMGALRGLEQGLCSLGYDQLGQMNNINANIMQTGFGIQQAINADTVANMQNTNALSRQLSECCCDNRAAIKDVQYSMATQNCATNTMIHQTGDAIINNQNAGFNMINQTVKDGFCALEMREMQRENATLRQQLNDCSRDRALQGTASYIIDAVNPQPRPAWMVPNPNVNYNYGYSNRGNNYDCDCRRECC